MGKGALIGSIGAGSAGIPGAPAVAGLAGAVLATGTLAAGGLAVPAHEPEIRISANAARPRLRWPVFGQAMDMNVGLR
jgi:hypothetical protein